MNLNTRWSNILIDESQVAFAEKYIDPDTTELIAGIELSEAGFEKLEKPLLSSCIQQDP